MVVIEGHHVPLLVYKKKKENENEASQRCQNNQNVNLNLFLQIFFLFHLEDNLIELLLQFFIGIIDTQLLEAKKKNLQKKKQIHFLLTQFV